MLEMPVQQLHKLSIPLLKKSFVHSNCTLACSDPAFCDFAMAEPALMQQTVPTLLSYTMSPCRHCVLHHGGRSHCKVTESWCKSRAACADLL